LKERAPFAPFQGLSEEIQEVRQPEPPMALPLELLQAELIAQMEAARAFVRVHAACWLPVYGKSRAKKLPRSNFG
jgi:hypothetical protein